jgi:hypothetical protein
MSNSIGVRLFLFQVNLSSSLLGFLLQFNLSNPNSDPLFLDLNPHHDLALSHELTFCSSRHQLDISDLKMTTFKSSNYYRMDTFEICCVM